MIPPITMSSTRDVDVETVNVLAISLCAWVSVSPVVTPGGPWAGPCAAWALTSRSLAWVTIVAPGVSSFLSSTGPEGANDSARCS